MLLITCIRRYEEIGKFGRPQANSLLVDPVLVCEVDSPALVPSTGMEVDYVAYQISIWLIFLLTY